MRVYLSIIVVSVLLGIGGIIGLSDAVSDYTGTLRTYTQIDATYDEGSFRWLEPDFNRASLTMTLHNDSPVDATVINIDLFLRFNGELDGQIVDNAFAGANYNRFDQVTIAAGDSQSVPLEIEVTTNSIQPIGGTAELSLRGSMEVEFEGIERRLTLDLADTIGVVPADASSLVSGPAR